MKSVIGHCCMIRSAAMQRQHLAPGGISATAAQQSKTKVDRPSDACLRDKEQQSSAY